MKVTKKTKTKQTQEPVSLILKLHNCWKHRGDYLFLGSPAALRTAWAGSPHSPEPRGRLFAFLMTLELGPSASLTPGPGSSVSAADGRLPPEAGAFLGTGTAGGHVGPPCNCFFHLVEAGKGSQPQFHTGCLSLSLHLDRYLPQGARSP